MKILIVVTHLLGTGHLARALTLARAMLAAGDTVVVASGGMPARHLDLGDVPILQLPPLRSDGVNFTRLLNADGIEANETLMARRQTALLDQLHADDWDVILTELFPFGRRVLRSEFLDLLETAQALPHRPLICASIRDILAPPSKPEKAEKTDAIIHQFYDAVLVHADPEITPLDVSWPVSEMLRPKLHYTGFVAPPPATTHPEKLGQDEIIVTAGGGNIGTPIFEAALEAARISHHNWRVLLGGENAADRAVEMSRHAPSNVVIEPARPEFRQMLHHAAACMCMCGYNTALDVLQSGCRAVFIPFDEGGEVEQSLRADALATLDGIAVLRSAELTPKRLLTSLRRVQDAPPRSTEAYGFDGAAQTVRILRKLREEML